ncbi:DUF885 domain-containing protein [Pseudoalteromonas sp. C2R02]|uniref:DUF885 domain-containing protein n=1 Tax=Pseudoalteromonas sp. C2R02 TaxID=2841565 RepID=UPI001C08BDAA|nr:DUF885 domain-containing protein [Pseudoalteromonas sp. C2R02]MBU2970307.1 DUF885 domain-containing protein [Pseudoalteromonas sp. C2R02]
MNKITQFLIIFLLPVLVACNDAHIPKSKSTKGSIEQLKVLNHLLLPSDVVLNQSIDYPFDETYLMKRHQIYTDLSFFEISSGTGAKAELDYLMIQQRFPERYFPWPSAINVLDTVLTNTSTTQNSALLSDATIWLRFVQTRLEEATKSNIKLNKMAHSDLIARITLVNEKLNNVNIKESTELTEFRSALEQLKTYVLKYKPRNMLGLRQMPNGVDWYQSKLNYFLGGVKAPDEWLIAIQSELKSLEGENVVAIDKMSDAALQKQLNEAGFILPQPLLTSLVSQFGIEILNVKVNGLDWQQGYINYNETFEALYEKPGSIHSNFKLFWLTIAEIDLGIHYQGWGLKQAQHVLNKRFDLTEDEVTSLIEHVVFYPGQIMSGAKGLLEKK